MRVRQGKVVRVFENQRVGSFMVQSFRCDGGMYDVILFHVSMLLNMF